MEYSWNCTEAVDSHQWLMRRNCALSPKQLALWFAAISSVSIAVGCFFALAGAWMVLPFAFLEVTALAIAFVVYARHAADFERIVFQSEGLLVERCMGNFVERTEVPLNWLRIEYQGQRRELVKLVSAGKFCEVGRFVPEHQRNQLAKQLRRACSGAPQWA
ncbi:MAG: DUF2244 domain-containing protein [Betaproteobacteria bacterium]|nr:DUF2244 domain-containing protein [Betaproteobacteria bacterium]